jgi:hypothetical protein
MNNKNLDNINAIIEYLFEKKDYIRLLHSWVGENPKSSVVDFVKMSQIEDEYNETQFFLIYFLFDKDNYHQWKDYCIEKSNLVQPNMLYQLLAYNILGNSSKNFTPFSYKEEVFEFVDLFDSFDSQQNKSISEKNLMNLEPEVLSIMKTSLEEDFNFSLISLSIHPMKSKIAKLREGAESSKNISYLK